MEVEVKQTTGSIPPLIFPEVSQLLVLEQQQFKFRVFNRIY